MPTKKTEVTQEIETNLQEKPVLKEVKGNYFAELYNVDVSDKIEHKNNLAYVSWADAWAEIKKKHPLATYKVYETENGLLYFHNGDTANVKTSVTIPIEVYVDDVFVEYRDIEHIEYLPIMDFKNQSIKISDTKNFTSMAVNKAIQRSLTKACARHGIGLYVYAGEDLPEEAKIEKEKEEANSRQKQLEEAERLALVQKEIDKLDKLIKTTLTKNEKAKDEVISIITKHNNDEKNYKIIKDIEIVKVIMKEIKAIKLVEEKGE